MATTADFESALAQVLKYEGGYVNNPADPGGATNKGITQATYNAWRASQGLPAQDVRKIQADEVRAIYFDRYWLASGADKLAMPLALIHFDSAVNTGVGQAGKFLSQSGGVAARYLDIRKTFYENLAAKRPELAQFLNGWLKRVGNLATTTAGASTLALLLLGVGVWFLARRGAHA